MLSLIIIWMVPTLHHNIGDLGQQKYHLDIMVSFNRILKECIYLSNDIDPDIDVEINTYSIGLMLTVIMWWWVSDSGRRHVKMLTVFQ